MADLSTWTFPFELLLEHLRTRLAHRVQLLHLEPVKLKALLLKNLACFARVLLLMDNRPEIFKLLNLNTGGCSRCTAPFSVAYHAAALFARAADWPMFPRGCARATASQLEFAGMNLQTCPTKLMLPTKPEGFGTKLAHPSTMSGVCT